MRYRVRYRAKNVNGWSGWSPIGLIQTATRPLAPQPPTLVSASGSELRMLINPSLNNGGAIITQYKLFKDGGSFSTTFTLIATFDADEIAPTEFVLQTSTPAHDITAGERYRFITVATNDIGDSDPSEEVFFTVSTLP